MKTTRAALACLLALASAGAVLADGVPLITAGPALAANDNARQLKGVSAPDFVNLHPITLNKAAFGANVLTVVIDGKEHRFGGSMMALRPPVPKTVTVRQPESISWSGTEPGGGTLVVSKDVDTGGILATMFLPPNRIFHIAAPPNGSTVLIEGDTNVKPLVISAPEVPASATARSKS